MIPTLLSTLTLAIVGSVEIAPGLCQTEILVDATEIPTEIIHCQPSDSEG